MIPLPGDTMILDTEEFRVTVVSQEEWSSGYISLRAFSVTTGKFKKILHNKIDKEDKTVRIISSPLSDYFTSMKKCVGCLVRNCWECPDRGRKNDFRLDFTHFPNSLNVLGRRGPFWTITGLTLERGCDRTTDIFMDQGRFENYVWSVLPGRLGVSYRYHYQTGFNFVTGKKALKLIREVNDD
jgi:hypothetical protein